MILTECRIIKHIHKLKNNKINHFILHISPIFLVEASSYIRAFKVDGPQTSLCLISSSQLLQMLDEILASHLTFPGFYHIYSHAPKSITSVLIALISSRLICLLVHENTYLNIYGELRDNHLILILPPSPKPALLLAFSF